MTIQVQSTGSNNLNHHPSQIPTTVEISTNTTNTTAGIVSPPLIIRQVSFDESPFDEVAHVSDHGEDTASPSSETTVVDQPESGTSSTFEKLTSYWLSNLSLIHI